MTDDSQLLEQYREGSEAAFRELVARYINLVYSAAARHLAEVQQAEDVVQTVFAAFARKARTLPLDVVLGGWLYRHTCFVASQAVRAERRRQAREKQAVEMNLLNDHTEPDWERLSPVLDQAMRQLGSRDRDAVVLRFFEGRNLQYVGSALGISEEAARKRVTRALDKLREFFARRGVTLSASALATLLAEHAVTAAPVGLAAAVSGTALVVGAATGSGYSVALLKLTTMTNLKIGIVTAAVVVAVVAPLALHYQSRANLRQADEALQQQASALSVAQSENERLAGLSAQADSASTQSKDLSRLRAQSSSLATKKDDLAKLQRDNRRLQKTADKPDQPPTPEQEQEVMSKMNYGKSAVLTCMISARTNQGRFPASFAQVAPFLSESMKAEADPTGDGFEVLYHGAFKALGALTNASEVIVIRQKEPSRYGNRWAKVYVCGDGHCEIHTQAEKDFTDWETAHRVPEPVKGH